MSQRSNPFEELERLFERMSQQFEETSREWGGDGWGFGAATDMAADVVERSDEYVVTLDLPGFERSDVEVRVSDHRLTVDAEHDDEMTDTRDTYLRRERRHESLHRVVRLPDAVDEDAVEARMKHGVLTVTLPRLERDEAHAIEIQE